MADNVVIYWVPKDGTMYAANMATRRFVGISNPERLAASQRALEFAGIPQKGWDRGEPLTMEEFGTEVLGDRLLLDRIEAQGNRAFDRIEAQGLRAFDTANEAVRRLGVLLGWNVGAAGSNEDTAFAVLRTYQYTCVVDRDSGAWYAVAPGKFWHLMDFTEVAKMRASRLMSDTQNVMSHADVVELHKLVQRGVDAELWPVPPPKTYTVVGGDTLTKISIATGVAIADLIAWNKLPSGDAINIGQVLLLSSP